MANAKVLATVITLENNGYLFKATGQVITFDGFMKVYDRYMDSEEVILPDFSNYNSKVIVAEDITKEQHFTKPLPRFTESSLIKELEALGIGRPSTYAKILETIKERNYVKVNDKKFYPTEIGITTTDKLQEFFSNIINVKYTANMENELDEIANNQMDYLKVLKEFYKEFEPLVKKAFDEMEKKEAEETGEECPECGSPLVIRNGKYGPFVACSNYPECKYIKPKEESEICACPKCGEGKIVEKRSKRGKIFYGCNNYPKCKTAYWDKPIGEACPKCGEMLVEKNRKIKCSSCDYER